MLICLFPAILKSQCYTVLSIQGEIILEKSGQPINEMDELCAKDKLIFSTYDSKAEVLSPKHGRYIIQLPEDKKSNKLKAYLEDVLSQGTVILGRKGIGNLDSEFGDNYFVIGISKIIVNSFDYPLNDKCFFYLTYLFEGKDINKKLKFDKDTLFIDNNVYKIEDKNIEQGKIDNVSLYYYELDRSTSTKICSFKLRFADEQKLNKEISEYISILKNSGNDDDFIIQETILFLTDIYGNVNTDNVKSWLGINFGLK